MPYDAKLLEILRNRPSVKGVDEISDDRFGDGLRIYVEKEHRLVDEIISQALHLHGMGVLDVILRDDEAVIRSYATHDLRLEALSSLNQIRSYD